MFSQVGGRDHPGTDGGGGQVDGADAGLGITRRGVAMHVGTGGLEHHVGLLVSRKQPVHPLMAGLQPELAGPREAFAVRVDADHPARLEPLRPPQFVQQIGTDVAGPDDRDGGFGRHVLSLFERQVD